MNAFKMTILLLAVMMTVALTGCPQVTVTVTADPASIDVGATSIVTASSTSADDTDYTWSVSDEAVATIVEDDANPAQATVTGVAAGTVTVTATANTSGKAGTVDITVNEVAVEGEEEGQAEEGQAEEGQAEEGQAEEGQAQEGEPAVDPTKRQINVNVRWSSDTRTRLEGVNNVGVGTDVELTAIAWEKEVATHDDYTQGNWTLVSAPEGSAVALDSNTFAIPSEASVTFRPDVPGTYTIQLAVGADWAEGEKPVATKTLPTFVVNAADFVGVGIVNVDNETQSATDVEPLTGGRCTSCHNDNIAPDMVTPWLATGHATKLQAHINNWYGVAESETYYRSYCLPCHTVGYDLGADNGGFDDVQDGWTIPAWSADMSGNWAAMAQDYPDAAARASVQCENCHGPAGEHIADGDGHKMAANLDSRTCLPCHGQVAQLDLSGHSHGNSVIFRDWESTNQVAFRATTPSEQNPYPDQNSNCSKCHSGRGFIRYSEDKTGASAQAESPRTHTCSVCHDPHSDENEAQLRVVDSTFVPWPADPAQAAASSQPGQLLTGLGVNATCITCHSGRKYAAMADGSSARFALHGIPAAGTLLGQNVVDYDGTYSFENSYHSDAAGCVDCHMAATPGTPHRVDHPFENMVGAHTFAMTTDQVNPLYVEGEPASSFVDEHGEFENVNGCNVSGCHTGIETFDRTSRKDYDGDSETEGVMTEIDGLETALASAISARWTWLTADGATLSPEFTTWSSVAEYTALSSEEKKALRRAFFNLEAIHGDPGAAVHNTKFAAGVLQATYKEVTGSDIATGSAIAYDTK